MTEVAHLLRSNIVLAEKNLYDHEAWAQQKKFYTLAKFYIFALSSVSIRSTLKNLASEMIQSITHIKALGGGIHLLTGNYAGFWSIKISPNYRIIFRYSNGDVFDVDYVDYH